MITIKLTPEQLEAVKIAFIEIQNSGDWAEYYSEEEVKNVFETSDFFSGIKA